MGDNSSVSSTARANAHVIQDAVVGRGRPAEWPAVNGDLLQRYQLFRDTDAALHDALDSAEIGVRDHDLRTRRAVRPITLDRVYGYAHARDECTFDTYLGHVAPEQRDLVRTRFSQCVTTGAAVFDCRIVRADGSPGSIWSRGRLVRDAGGRPARIVGIVMDATAQQTAEKTLELERRRKEAFVSTLAHEIRQPLAALRAAVEVVRLTSSSEGARRAAQIMDRQIRQMNRVVDDLMDATRWSTGKLSLRKQRLDVRTVVAEAAAGVARAVAERGHELVVATPSEPLWVDADPQRLQQVLSNLLDNAVKYTAPGGEIGLAADRTGTDVTLRVVDSGRGIDHESLPHVFELFSQQQPSEGEGLGIGLSVAREIVVQHGGRIAVSSAGEGRGTEFVITLPLSSPTLDV
jgi:signal transduction histidine kinase